MKTTGYSFDRKNPIFWLFIAVIIIGIVAIVCLSAHNTDKNGEGGNTTAVTFEETIEETIDVTEKETAEETVAETEKIPETAKETEAETTPPVVVKNRVLEREEYSTRSSKGPIVEKGSQPTEYTIIRDDVEFEKFFDKYNDKYPFLDSTRSYLKMNCWNHAQGARTWNKSQAVIVAIVLESNTAWQSMFPMLPFINEVSVSNQELVINIEKNRLDTGSTSVHFAFLSVNRKDLRNKIVINETEPETDTNKATVWRGFECETAFVTRDTTEGRGATVYFPSVYEDAESLSKLLNQYNAYYDRTAEYFPKTFKQVLEKYDDAFFEENVLVKVLGVMPKKGYYQLDRIEFFEKIMHIVLEDDNVIEKGTIDNFGYSSEYYIFIEIPRSVYSNYEITMKDCVAE